MLTMNINRETFDTILAGQRRTIQKTASPFWVRRVARIVGLDPDKNDVGKIMRTAGHYRIKSLKFENLALRCGNGHNADVMEVSGYAYMRHASKSAPESIWLVIQEARLPDPDAEELGDPPCPFS